MAYWKLAAAPLSVALVYFTLLAIVFLLVLLGFGCDALVRRVLKNRYNGFERLWQSPYRHASRRAARWSAVPAVLVHAWYAAVARTLALESGQRGGSPAATHGAALLSIAAGASVFYICLRQLWASEWDRKVATGAVGTASLGGYLWFVNDPAMAERASELWAAFALAGLEMMLE